MDFKRKLPYKHKIFNKLLLTSSITIIATVSILFVTITNYYSEVLIQREMDLSTRTLERVDDYFTRKETDVTNMIRDLYGKDGLINDMSYALQNGYQDYLKYRLDRYTDSPSFVPMDINTFFNGYFDQYNDVNAISLQANETPSIEYLFIYNYLRWNSSIIKESIDYSTIEYYQNELNPIPYVKIPSRELQDTFIIKRDINNPSTLKKMGEVSVYYTTDELNEMIKKRKTEAKSSIFLLNDDGEILYSSNQAIPTQMIQGSSQETNEKVMKWEGETYYVNSIAGHNHFTYIAVIPQKELNKLTIVRGTMWLVIAISTFIAILITYSLMRNYSSRIKDIDSAIREVEKGNLAVRIPEFKQKDELSTIANSFNSMLDELNSYIDRFYVLNIKQQQAELKALQSQINPHFLFNTLEVIRMAAVIEGSKTSSKMIYHLSRLFRYTLDSKETVPLYIELDHTNQYLQLMQLHHPNKLDIIVDIPKDIENIPIQKLILQPVIENYMIHGFRKDQTDNHLEIRVSRVEEKIEITVKDNGIGISKARLKEIMDHLDDKGDVIQSIGLKNVHQRLRLKYGTDYGLSIQSMEGIETIITISIPIGGNSHV
ncbi:sensor histidine kinase [Lederbergia lenta]|uniref:Two-component sensor histidine kinase n=1 Tax=Lederbergia lenta TaxID=1467 RepID=A0A2X4WFW8_LEDLE|nr:sensor histidine kinase [Lederbergia lenta]MCM3111781.1 sensor histidine kinase [Lederbergia lenta]MEC2322935.1 sensor histidine kinase [Lederbergia lenta]SQI62071.1 two-component sensor histidine kinase [Lederbergia lenta]